MGRGLAFFEQLPPLTFFRRPATVSQFKMPNWCENHAEITHDDDDMMARLNAAAERASRLPYPPIGFFGEFVPFPEGQGWTREWCLANWGTKWDASGMTGGDGSFIFTTAWGPPIAFYRAMERLGFEVRALYAEPGTHLVGRFVGGDDDNYPAATRADMANWPDELVETFGGWFRDVFDDGEEEEEEEAVPAAPIVPVPPTKAFIKKAHREIFAKFLAEPTESVCLICHDTLELTDPGKFILTACKHIYHRTCLKDWVGPGVVGSNRSKCPMCRDIIIVRREEKESSQETAAEHSEDGAHAGAGAVDE
jgi:hypothetical protein